MNTNYEQCPLCGTKLSETKSKEIESKLNEELQVKAAERFKAEQDIRLTLEKEFQQNAARQQEANDRRTAAAIEAANKKTEEAQARAVEAKKAAEAEIMKERSAFELKMKEEAARYADNLKADFDELAKKLSESQDREADIRTRAAQEIARERQEAQARAKDEATRQAKIAADEKAEISRQLLEAQRRSQEVEKSMAAEIIKEREAAELQASQRFAEQIGNLAAERDEAARKAKEAELRESDIRNEIRLTSEREIASQRKLLETDKNMALLKQQAEFNRERESLQGKLLSLDKQLQKKTANELGDAAEIDLYESMRSEFPTDNVSRIPKGKPGADILHEILYKGTACGRIIIDCKNHQGWQNAFISKLRQDRIDANAEHAILATTVFPAGKKEMCIESEIIVVSPARVPYVVHLLRNAMVTMHVKGLSMKERHTKMDRLYELITSESYARRFAEVGKLTEELLELDVKEKKSHDDVWKKRGTLAKRMQHSLREAETEIAAVIESTDHDEDFKGFAVQSQTSLSESNGIEKAV